MKKTNLFAVLFVISLLAKAQIQFDKRYLLGLASVGLKLVEVPGGYVSVGANIADTTTYNNNIIVKTNYNGDTIKTLYLPPPDSTYWNLHNEDPDDIFTDIIITNDSNLMVLGKSQAFNPNNYYHYDIWIIKLNYNLDTIWTKVYTHNSPDTSLIPQNIIQTDDSSFIICGKQRSGGFQNWYGFLYKVDSNGNFLWYKNYNNPGPYLAIWDVIETPQHNLICSGTQVISNINDDMNNMLFIADGYGTQIWDTIILTAGEDYGVDLNHAPDSNIIWLGCARLGSTTFDPLANSIRKVDYNGNVLWSKSYQQYYNGGAIALTKAINSGYIFTGLTDKTTNIFTAFIHRLDENGDSLWYREFNSPFYDDFWDIKTTTDGGYIMCGQTADCNNNGGTCFWLVKTDSLGLLISSITEPVKASISLSVYPNPVRDNLTIFYKLPLEFVPDKNYGKRGNYILMFNMQGKQVGEYAIQKATDKIQLNVSALSSGNYLAVLVMDGYNLASAKIIKE